MAAASRLVRFLVNAHVSIYRLTRGWIGSKAGRIDMLLLTTTGRRSGRLLTIPLLYVKDGEDYVVTASNGGGPSHPGWYFNLMDSPHARIEVGRQKFDVTAVQAIPQQRSPLWAKLVRSYPGYERYRQRTSREIPVVILHPRD